MTSIASMSRRRHVAALAGLVLGGSLPSVRAQGGAVPMAELSDMRKALQTHSAVVIDVREPEEHAGGVAEGARLLPMSQLKERLDEIPRDQPVLLVCRTQNRSSSVAAALRERGWTQVQAVRGGMSGWNQLGWPTVQPAKGPAAPAR